MDKESKDILSLVLIGGLGYIWWRSRQEQGLGLGSSSPFFYNSALALSSPDSLGDLGDAERKLRALSVEPAWFPRVESKVLAICS